MRGKTRHIKFLKTFENLQCGCGESEPEVLCWYPHHTTIHSLYTRWASNTEQRKDADKLMNESRVVCKNCAGRIEHARITNQELPFYI
jgi:hypothetical protein